MQQEQNTARLFVCFQQLLRLFLASLNLASNSYLMLFAAAIAAAAVEQK